RESRAAQGPGTPSIERASTSTSASSRAASVSPEAIAAARDRFYKYLEATNEANGRERWRQARELIDELKAMGPAAGHALMQVLAAGNDTDERRAAARLLGQLQVAQALPMLKDIVERDSDLLLRRAAPAGLRQLQTPESLAVPGRS